MLCTLIADKAGQNFRNNYFLMSSKISKSQNLSRNDLRLWQFQNIRKLHIFILILHGTGAPYSVNKVIHSLHAAGTACSPVRSETSLKNKWKGEVRTPVMRHFEVWSQTEKRIKAGSSFQVSQSGFHFCANQKRYQFHLQIWIEI